MVQVVPASPNEMIASGQKLDALSPWRTSNGRSPYTWQTELIDQVTWCSRAMRTRPAQKNAVSAPCHDQVISPPITAGPSSEIETSSGKSRSMRLMSLSASRSGAKRSRLDSSRPNSQPMWAWNMPLVRPRTLPPKRHGECGSPSRSEKAWWRRWSATHWVMLPCTAKEPATARAIRSQRLALNEPWVK